MDHFLNSQHLVLRQTTVLVPVIPFQTVFTEPLVGNRRGHVVGPDERRQQRIGLFVVVGTAGKQRQTQQQAEGFPREIRFHRLWIQGVRSTIRRGKHRSERVPPLQSVGGGRCRGRPDRRIGPIGIGDNTRRRDRSIREGGFGLVITNIRNNFPILQLFPQKNRGGVNYSIRA